MPVAFRPTRPEVAAFVRRAVSPEVAGRLSPAAYETLAIVAYQQPVTRARVEEIRGVSCDSVLNNLELRALITEVGAPRATVITYVNPAVALALGVALLGEPFTVGIAIGFVLIVLGSVLATRRASTSPTRVSLTEERRPMQSSE